MIIIKIGGGGINLDYLAQDLAENFQKEEIILVHGASRKRDEIAEKLDCPTRTIVSPSKITSVYTDSKALEVFLMVYSGLVNKQVVAKMRLFGLNAVGLSGVDGGLWTAKAKKELYTDEGGKTRLIKDNLTGRVEKINVDLLRLLVKNNYFPVLCPPAISYENEIVNTDNDWAVSVMAGSLGVKKIVVLFEAPGLLKNPNDEKTLIRQVKKEELKNYLIFAEGRMKKKVLGAEKAFELGVEKVYWGDGRIKNPITSALAGEGTIIC